MSKKYRINNYMRLDEVDGTDKIKQAGEIVQQMFNKKHKIMSWDSDSKPTIRGLVEQLDDPFLMSLTKDIDMFLKYGQAWVDLNPNDIFKKETDLPAIDDILKDPEYFADKKSTAFKIVNMRPTMYGIHTKFGFGNTEENFTPEADLVYKYALQVLDGSKMPLPYLRYTLNDGNIKFGQEGRHRATVAKVLGAETMPVMIVAEVFPPSSDNEKVKNFQNKIWNEFK